MISPTSPLGGAILATVTATSVLALPDEHGEERRITLHGTGHYTIDGRTRPHSLMVGHPDYSVHLAAEVEGDPLARLRFPHLGSWDSRYLGYENLWMLIANYPHEFSQQGVGARCRLDGLAAQSCWLTIKRALVGDLLTDVIFVGPTRDAALRLLVHWLQDRVSDSWDGEAQNDHSLRFTPIWAELGGGRIAALSFTDHREAFDDERRHTAPQVWTYRHDVPRPGSAPISLTREYLATDADDTAKAFAALARALSHDGAHWR